MQSNAHVRNHQGLSTEAVALPDTLLWESLAHLQLNIAQTAAMCGISVRQLGYWTKQGYVAAEGVGERRMYGMVALRRILAIRRRMSEGASLRQALKSLPLSEAAQTFPVEPPLAYTSTASPSDLPTAEQAKALSESLVALFDHNRHVRDSADGLAVKLGRASALVRSLAESLCTQGILGKTVVQDEAIYQRLERTAT